MHPHTLDAAFSLLPARAGAGAQVRVRARVPVQASVQAPVQAPEQYTVQVLVEQEKALCNGDGVSMLVPLRPGRRKVDATYRQNLAHGIDLTELQPRCAHAYMRVEHTKLHALNVIVGVCLLNPH